MIICTKNYCYWSRFVGNIWEYLRGQVFLRHRVDQHLWTAIFSVEPALHSSQTFTICTQINATYNQAGGLTYSCHLPMSQNHIYVMYAAVGRYWKYIVPVVHEVDSLPAVSQPSLHCLQTQPHLQQNSNNQYNKLAGFRCSQLRYPSLTKTFLHEPSFCKSTYLSLLLN